MYFKKGWVESDPPPFRKRVKKVTKSYCKVKTYHYGREYTEKMTEEKVRKKLTKLINFKNQ